MKSNEYISLSDWDKLSPEEQEGVLNYLLLFHSIGRPQWLRSAFHNHLYDHPTYKYLWYGSVIMDDEEFISLTDLKRMAQLGRFV